MTNEIIHQNDVDVKSITDIELANRLSGFRIDTRHLSRFLSKNYPELQGNLPNVADYDTIFVGGPVWWYTMAPALYSYLKVTDFGGARVVPFSTQGSNFGSFYKDFADMAQNAQILPSENFNNIDEKYKEQVSNKINAWLNKLSK